jgi:hypothetical protein
MYQYPSLEPLGGPADVGLVAVKDPDSVQMTFPTDAQSRSETLKQTDVEFGERIALLGHDSNLIDNRLQMILYWQAERPLDQNWTVFVHLLDSAGNLVTQQDSQPRAGRYPTSVWDQGEVVEDLHDLVLPPDLAEGDYQVVVGLYTVADGVRLPVLDSQGNSTGDTLPLVTLRLADGKWGIN